VSGFEVATTVKVAGFLHQLVKQFVKALLQQASAYSVQGINNRATHTNSFGKLVHFIHRQVLELICQKVLVVN